MSHLSIVHGGRVEDFVRKLKSKGVRGTYRSVAARLRWDVAEWMRERYWEHKLGISTAGDIRGDALGHDHPDYHGYGPSRYGSLRRILGALAIENGRDVFIDFGSGKGRVLVLAAMHPFRQVIGVDCSRDLNDIAARNIENARHWMKCQHIDIVAMDAAAYTLPDDATVLYFANPFSGDVLERVLENIKASLMRAPRPISLISHNHEPTYPFEQQIRSCRWLQVRTTIRLQRNTRAWIYTNSRLAPMTMKNPPSR
jgi:16S rRNA G966 N2-methylase RsmD